MKLLITGGCGFLGSNLAIYAIRQKYDVTVFDNLCRAGSAENLSWLKTQGNFRFIHGDIRNRNDTEYLIKKGFDAVFHLAGQVAMTTSVENPYYDFETNALGTLNLLEAIRKYTKNTSIFYSSTNKVYGDLEQYEYFENETRYMCPQYPNGFNEMIPLDFRSPYGCSKGSADQYVLDYHRMFGLKTTVFRHSSMYGNRQFATYDQGWVGWFCQKAIDLYKNHTSEPFAISGNGKQVRDILHADDMVRLYFDALIYNDKVEGEAFNIGGTMEQSLSLLELFEILNSFLGIKIKYTQLPVRTSDQKVFVADISKINTRVGWKPKVSARTGIKKMLEWVKGI
jgi:CDP-paratose 2-epimerase